MIKLEEYVWVKIKHHCNRNKQWNELCLITVIALFLHLSSRGRACHVAISGLYKNRKAGECHNYSFVMQSEEFPLHFKYRDSDFYETDQTSIGLGSK